MQSSTLSDFAAGRAREMAWTLWAELGVSGWRETVVIDSVDVEPLILFTAWLGNLDQRLWSESLDWCVHNHRLVSATRLRRSLKNADAEVTGPFMEFSATLRSLVPKANWPEGGSPRQVKLSGKSREPRLDRAPLVQLRIRALFGVSARAEILRTLLIDRPRGWSASELAQEAGYAKVNVASALDLLTSTGHVRIDSTGTQFRYRLAKAPQLAEFAGPIPSFQPDWSARLAVVRGLVISESNRSPRDPLARAAQRVAILEQMANALGRLGLFGLAPKAKDPGFDTGFDKFSTGLLNYWAGESGRNDSSELEYEVRRNERGWEGVVRESGRAEAPLTLPDWNDLYKEMPRSDYLVPDDSTGPLLLAHELMRRAFVRIGLRLEPFQFQPETFTFANEQLRSIPVGSSRAFGEAFLRFWAFERMARAGRGEIHFG